MFLAGVCCLILGSFAIASQSEGNVSSEVWGARGIILKANPQGATVEFDCAHGVISHPIDADSQGEFTIPGTYTPESGGPVQKNSAARDLPATYKGSIHGDTMQLQVTFGEENRPLPAYTLTRGNPGRLVKCR